MTSRQCFEFQRKRNHGKVRFTNEKNLKYCRNIKNNRNVNSIRASMKGKLKSDEVIELGHVTPFRTGREPLRLYED